MLNTKIVQVCDCSETNTSLSFSLGWCIFHVECIPDWIGDTICDDFNNQEPCHFDANDCCGDLGPHQFSSCFECVCKT